MHQVIYSSAAVEPFSEASLAQLLARARLHNERLGITGLLLYDDGSFLQVLEGDQSVIEQLYETIGRDKRHHRVVALLRRDVAERHFGEWRMGFAAMTTISKRLPVIQSTCRPVASRAQPQVRQTGYLRHFATGGFTATSRPSRLTFPVFQRVAAQLSRAGSDQTIALLGVARS